MRTRCAKQKRPREQFVYKLFAGLVLVAVLGTSFGIQVPRTHAIPVVEVGGNFIATAIKEIPLDLIAFTMAKIALQKIQQATLRWINSGFKGSPAFVQDLGGFLQKSADEVAGEFIYGSELNALCRPFALDVRIMLSLRSRREAPVRCTLSQVVGNVDNFFNDLASGGLAGWFAMTVNPNNNFFGASAGAQSALLGRLADRKEININKLLFDKGFLSTEKCTPVEEVADADIDGNTFERKARVGEEIEDADIDGNTFKRKPKEACKTVTPGSAISEALSFNLSTGQQTLISADEINEIISALFQQLALQAFTGAGGLLGLGERGSDGSPAYLDRVGDPRYDRVPGQTTIGNSFIRDAIRTEEAYRALYADIVSRADGIIARIAHLEAQEAADEELQCSDMSSLRAQTQQIRAQALPKLQAANANLATLRGLEARYNLSAMRFSSEAAEQGLTVVEEFLGLQASGVLHNADAVASEQAVVAPIQTQLATIADQVETSCRRIERENNDNGGSEA